MQAPTMDRSLSPPNPPATVNLVQVEQLRSLVQRNARRWKFLVILEALGLAIFVPLACLWLAVFVDTQVHLSMLGRCLGSLVFVGGALFLGARLVRRWQQIQLSDDQVALAIERRTPGGVQNRLINAVQIAREGRSAQVDLSDAVVAENCRHLEQIELQQAMQSRSALAIAALALAMIALGILSWVLQPEQFATATRRILLPFANIDPVYRTTLDVSPGDTETAGDVTIEVTIHGTRPDMLTILSNVQGKRTSEEIPVSATGTVRHTFKNVLQNMTYAVRGNDFTTSWYRIDVPTAPQLSLLRVALQLPEYTGLADRKFEKAGGDLEALQGSTAQVVFVFDQPAEKATLLLEAVVQGKPAVSQRVELKRLSSTEFAGSILFQDLTGYQIETAQGERSSQTSRFALRVQIDQEPKLELTGLERQTEVQVDAKLPLQITASDDYGLEKVGVFARRAGETKPGDDSEGWQSVVTWPANRQVGFRQDFALAINTLNATEGEKLEIALRAVDTDPLKNGRWTTGATYTLLIGGEGVGLQLTYEQILRAEADLKALVDAQQKATAAVTDWIAKLDGEGDLRWDDAKNIDALHAAVKEQRAAQEKVRKSAGHTARAIVPQVGHLRISVGLLADTEMVRALNIFDGVPARETPQAKRAALADARLTQQRCTRSLHEIIEQFAAFRADWELTNMTPFTKMLAERQAKLVELSLKQAGQADAGSAARRQEKVLQLCQLIQPAFVGIEARLKGTEPIIAAAFASGSATLHSESLLGPMRQATEQLKTSNWSGAAPHQAVAAKELSELHARLVAAQAEAARLALAALREAAKTDVEAQRAIEELKPGSAEGNVKDLSEKTKIEEIIRMREVAGARRRTASEEAAQPGKLPAFDPIDVKKLELMRDSGVRQDANILKLGKVAEKSQKIDPGAADRERNKVQPFIQEKFEDLVGKLLDEADELSKDFQTLTLSTNQNNSDPGDVAKQGGRINSTGAVAATGNKKPPTNNVGGVSRMGRSGARAYGSVVGDQNVARKGRDQAQEGEQRAPDQPGSVREKSSDDPYTDTSTGVGGKKVESDDTRFSTKDSGRFTNDMLQRLGDPQKKNYIVERMSDKMDPRAAEMLRDLTSRQQQIIERIQAIKKELRTLYLPTDHLDQVQRELQINLDRLKDRPEADLFRLQGQALDRLAGTVKVFNTARSGFQPSLPRERLIHGRVLDEPARQTLPGYEDAVKNYYEMLAR